VTHRKDQKNKEHFCTKINPQKVKKKMNDQYDGIEPSVFSIPEISLAVLGIEPRLKRVQHVIGINPIPQRHVLPLLVTYVSYEL
jgi:hypothetical protein